MSERTSSGHRPPPTLPKLKVFSDDLSSSITPDEKTQKVFFLRIEAIVPEFWIRTRLALEFARTQAPFVLFVKTSLQLILVFESLPDGLK